MDTSFYTRFTCLVYKKVLLLYGRGVSSIIGIVPYKGNVRVDGNCYTQDK